MCGIYIHKHKSIIFSFFLPACLSVEFIQSKIQEKRVKHMRDMYHLFLN